MNNSHIVFITSGHSPFSSRLFSKELKSLQKRYSNLTIIAPYHEVETVVDGIRVIGIKKYRSRYNRWSPLSSLYKHTVALRPHTVHCHEPDSLLVAYLLKKRFPEIRVIYDCHEFHPQSFTENFPAPFRYLLRILIEKIENFLASRVDAVITVNDRLVERFEKHNKLVVLLPNYPRLDIIRGKQRERDLFFNNEVHLIYAGGLSADRGLFKMIDVLKKLNNSINAQLILIGKFSAPVLEKNFWERVKKYNLSDKIDYKGYLSHEETMNHLINADIGLFLLDEKERYQWGEPTKYFEYSAVGLPIIISDLPAKRALIEKNGNGYLIPPDSVLEGVNAVKYLIENSHEARRMVEKGEKAFLEEYNWEAVEPRLFELYNRLL